MLLISATDEYQLDGQAKPGFPVLLNKDMTSCWEANEFFRYYLRRGAIGSQKSWTTIGQAIYDYFGFLEAHEFLWYEVSRGEEKNLMAAYRDYSFDVAKHKRNTVRLRLTYIGEFYKFALRRQWIDELPVTYETRHVRSDGFLGHLGQTIAVEVSDVMPRKHSDLIKFLTIDQARTLLEAAKNIHHRAIVRLALATGLRREELATFPLAYVFDPDTSPGGGVNVKVTLDPSDGTGMRTKGGKLRDIYMGREVMKMLYRYTMHHRQARASLSSTAHPNLFLNQSGMPYARDGKGLEAIVRGIGKRLGIRTYPHMLRHTFATHTLVALQRHRDKNRIEPLVFLQKQLGHSSIQTTMIYLHLVNGIADDAVLAYDEELNNMTGI